MENTEKYSKLYYSISEVAEKLNVNASLIRFWEKEFSAFLKLRKNRNGKRMFTSTDIDTLNLIYELTKKKGFTLPGARKWMKNNKKNQNSDNSTTDSLIKIRSMLVELKKQIGK
jgi:DNA-binding transcriptional MerR regulator